MNKRERERDMYIYGGGSETSLNFPGRRAHDSNIGFENGIIFTSACCVGDYMCIGLGGMGTGNFRGIESLSTCQYSFSVFFFFIRMTDVEDFFFFI